MDREITVWVIRESWMDAEDVRNVADHGPPCGGARLGVVRGQQAWFVKLETVWDLRQLIREIGLPVELSLSALSPGDLTMNILDYYSGSMY